MASFNKISLECYATNCWIARYDYKSLTNKRSPKYRFHFFYQTLRGLIEKRTWFLEFISNLHGMNILLRIFGNAYVVFSAVISRYLTKNAWTKDYLSIRKLKYIFNMFFFAELYLIRTLNLKKVQTLKRVYYVLMV